MKLLKMLKNWWWKMTGTHLVKTRYDRTPKLIVQHTFRVGLFRRKVCISSVWVDNHYQHETVVFLHKLNGEPWPINSSAWVETRLRREQDLREAHAKAIVDLRNRKLFKRVCGLPSQPFLANHCLSKVRGALFDCRIAVRNSYRRFVKAMTKRRRLIPYKVRRRYYKWLDERYERRMGVA